jgi:hypothetical protein
MESGQAEVVSFHLVGAKTSQERSAVMTVTDQQKSVLEQEVITILSQLHPLPITITPQTKEDGAIIYAWQAQYSSGTHPRFTEALRAALESSMYTLMSTPVQDSDEEDS